MAQCDMIRVVIFSLLYPQHDNSLYIYSPGNTELAFLGKRRFGPGNASGVQRNTD